MARHLWLYAAACGVVRGTKEVVLSKARVYVEEGGVGAYTVVLSEAPSADVVVSMAIGDDSLLKFLSGSSVTFTTSDWATPQAVDVKAKMNSDDSGLLFTDVSVVHASTSSDGDYDGGSASFVASDTVTVRIYDDDSCVRDCAPGTYYDACNSTRSCLPCLSGHYCGGGCSEPVACGAGTFLERTDGETAADCRPCAPGNYSAVAGAHADDGGV